MVTHDHDHECDDCPSCRLKSIAIELMNIGDCWEDIDVPSLCVELQHTGVLDNSQCTLILMALKAADLAANTAAAAIASAVGLE